MANLLEVVGALLIVTAAFMVAVPLGLALGGLCLLAAAYGLERKT